MAEAAFWAFLGAASLLIGTELAFLLGPGPGALVLWPSPMALSA